MIFWTLFIHTSLITFKISCSSVNVQITDLTDKGIRRGSKQKGWRCDENLITFHFSLSSERGLQNKCELVFNILVINVKAPAHHICTWCDCRWQISQTCYLSSPQLTLFFVLGFLFCWEVTEGLIKKAGNSSILKKAPVQPWQSAHGFRPTRTWPAVSPPTHAHTHRHTRRLSHTPELPTLTISTTRLLAATSHLVCRLSHC